MGLGTIPNDSRERTTPYDNDGNDEDRTVTACLCKGPLGKH
jgi:hypothetical protein